MRNRSLLASRRFAPLFWTQGFSVLGDHLLRNAAIFAIVFEFAVNDPGAASDYSSLALAAFSAPYMLFSSIAGELVDRYEKRTLVRLIMGADVAIMIFALIALRYEMLGLLVTALFAAGLRSTLFGPLKYAILPQHLPESELVRAAGFIQASSVCAIVTGQFAGGLLHQSLAGFFLVTLATVAFGASLLIEKGPPERPLVTIDPNIVRGSIRVLRATLAEPPLRRAVMALSWFYALGAVLSGQFAAFARNELGMGRSGATLLLLALTGGIIGGSLAVGQMKPQTLARLPAPALFACGLFLLDLSACGLTGAAFAWRVALDVFGFGATIAAFGVPFQAVLQTAGPIERRGRDLAANNITNAIAALVALGAAAALTEAGLAIAGVIAILGVISLTLAFVELRSARSRHPIG